MVWGVFVRMPKLHQLVQLHQKLIMDMGVRTNWFRISKFKMQMQRHRKKIKYSEMRIEKLKNYT
jgi:hypothetical protein